MIKKLEKRLENEPSTENPAKRQKISKPICRQCRCEFDLVLHCHCSTRCGHNECMENFKERV